MNQLQPNFIKGLTQFRDQVGLPNMMPNQGFLPPNMQGQLQNPQIFHNNFNNMNNQAINTNINQANQNMGSNIQQNAQIKSNLPVQTQNVTPINNNNSQNNIQTAAQQKIQSIQKLNINTDDVVDSKLLVEKYDFLKYPPSNQIEYRSILLEFLISDLFDFPVHEAELHEKITLYFQKIQKNAHYVMNTLQMTPLLQELNEKNALSLEQHCVGTKQMHFILDIYKEKLKQLSKEFFKDRPKIMPTFNKQLLSTDLLNPKPQLMNNNFSNSLISLNLNQNSKLSGQQQTEIESLLSTKIGYQKVISEQTEEISNLVNKQSVEETQALQKFKKAGSSKIDFCNFGTREKCRQLNKLPMCNKSHFRRIIQQHTDESLGNCSYLDTCRHLDHCKFVHYELDLGGLDNGFSMEEEAEQTNHLKPHENSIQWIQCDLRTIDFSCLGKFDVIMADPPWDIHMNLPYDTMKDKEMKGLRFDLLQDDGLLFLWVTGRAMELGRECMAIWGYRQVEELIWVKTNQLQRIIRTGRTGHWLNHSKEHCLVGIKGKPKINTNIDCDIIVSEVRETSRKPDEIYHLINRMFPGGRKIECFGRPHNCTNGWLTLGNQLPGVYIVEEAMQESYQKRYPEVDCTQEQMLKNKEKFENDKELDKIYNSHISVHNPPFKTRN